MPVRPAFRIIVRQRSIVKAYSYVKSGIYPDFAIIAGNPAKVIGDTRSLDKEYLEQYPTLKRFYQKWASTALLSLIGLHL